MCAKKASLSNARKGTADSKHHKIDVMQRNVVIAVGLMSIILSLTIVGAIRLSKYIAFNAKVIEEKSKVAKGYKQIQSDLETLRTDVSALVNDENLESVARFRNVADCFNNANKGVDNEEYSLEDIELARTCSALRVVPDALPSKENNLATLTNMNQLLRWANYGSGVKFEGPNGGSGGQSSNTGSTSSTLHPVSVSVSLNDSGKRVQGALKEIEDSVRNFDITSASLSWESDDFWTGQEFDNSELQFDGSFTAYYSDEVAISSKSRTVCANSKSEKCRAAGGDSVGDSYGQSSSGKSSSSSGGLLDDSGKSGDLGGEF
ncbi:hypothetical protein IJ847_01090 [Candidatus Saccharibacteria bacterium]|nr:hypothetical protein [Candidatus Saccharibacteria bacterium]